MIHFNWSVFELQEACFIKTLSTKSCATGKQFLLKFLREFSGAKTARNRFLLPQGKLCSAKIVLGAAKLPLRIKIGGVA
ncbi:MAG: hypothetical protein IJU28_09745, partial [Clostridia bacterium]|nr:hypothetical protein [Clostridia bacterium]